MFFAVFSVNTNPKPFNSEVKTSLFVLKCESGVKTSFCYQILKGERMNSREKKRDTSNTIKKFSLLGLVFITLLIVPLFGSSAFGKEMKMKMATYIPVNYPLVWQTQNFFVEQVNKTGKEIVQIDMFWGGTLLDGKQILSGLRAGTADIVFQTTAYFLGSFPVLGIQNLPIWPDIEYSHDKLKIGSPLYNLQNEVLKEKNMRQLAVGGTVIEYLWTRNKKVEKPSDLKGLKIRVAGKLEAIAIQMLGGTPLSMASAEVPMALQRGTIDGVLINPWTARGRGVEEHCKYMLLYPLTSQSTPIYMLADKWDKLPNNVKKVLNDAAMEWESYMVRIVSEEANLEKQILPYYRKVGMEMVYPNKEQTTAFKQALEPLVKWWVKEVGDEVGVKASKHIN